MTTKLTIRDLRGDDLFPILGLLEKLEVADRLPELVGEFTDTAGAPVPPVVARTSTDKKVQAQWVSYDEAVSKFTSARGLRIAGSLAKLLLANIGKVRGDLNRLLGDLTDTDEATVKALGLGAYFGLVKELAMHPDFREVFTSAVNSETVDGDDS